MNRYDVVHTLGYAEIGIALQTNRRAEAITECTRLNLRDYGAPGRGWRVRDNRTGQCVWNSQGEVKDDGND